jgi:hypothetical protein
MELRIQQDIAVHISSWGFRPGIGYMLSNVLLRTPATCARRMSWALAHTGDCLLYLVALLHLSSFFRFDVLV